MWSLRLLLVTYVLSFVGWFGFSRAYGLYHLLVIQLG